MDYRVYCCKNVRRDYVSLNSDQAVKIRSENAGGTWFSRGLPSDRLIVFGSFAYPEAIISVKEL